MPNTENERSDFKEALSIIAKKFQESVIGNANLNTLLAADTGRFDTLVKFMDRAVFATNRALSGKPAVGCTVLGFTDFLQNPPIIYINRDDYKKPTLIHELLHFLTHPNFHREFSAKIVEGTTEYFTRKAQAKADPINQSAFKEKRASYEPEHVEIYRLRQWFKGMLVPISWDIRDQPPKIGAHREDPLAGLPIIKGFMKKAYFQGDADSIQLFKRIIQTAT